MARKASQTETKDTPAAELVPQPVRRNIAGPCPKSPLHRQTLVYRTNGRTRYCKCNDCGHTWKVVDPAAGETAALAVDDRQYLADLADSLDAAPRVEHEGDEAVLMPDSHAREISARLRAMGG